jgi:ABC-type antimicrobial peptide transport system permease subunit
VNTYENKGILTVVAVAIFVSLVMTLIGSLLPALRAAQVDPVIARRAD